MFKLRDYQEEGIRACVDILTSKRPTCKKLVVAPTAGGKSIYVAETVKRVDEPLLIRQPSKELLMLSLSEEVLQDYLLQFLAHEMVQRHY